MRRLSEEMLQDIEKDTVDFRPNYDANDQEPVVLPARIPQLLLNGSVGIAVGMATNIPPHNFTELSDTILHLIDHPEATVEDLCTFVKGPDFPTGGIVYGRKALQQAYLTGRGSVIVRGVAEIEEVKGRQQIKITEIPYQVNKSSLVERMAELVNEKIVQGVSDIRDESNREGIRIIVELKKDSYPQKILNQFYKHTPLQSSFGYNMIALADGLQPRLLNLKELLEIFIGHRREVMVRRITFDRDRAKERAHILEGLSKALDNIDAVIQTIKKSETKEIAKENLIKKFKLTSIQADAILQMRLQTLAGLERKKIEDELAEKLKFMKECEALLKDNSKRDQNLKDETEELKKLYGDERRTRVMASAIGEFSAKDTIPNAPMIVVLTQQGYVKRLSPQQFRAQNRGGKGVIGMTTKDEDELLQMQYAMNHDDLLCFTNTGRVFTLPVYELPQGSRTAKGQAIVNLLALQPEEKITAILLSKLEGKKHLFMATKHGTVKRTDLSEFENIRRSGLIAQKIPKGDELKWVVATTAADQIFILSKKGKAIRFPEKDVRTMGRAAAGVRGIRLGTGDEVVAVASVALPDLSSLLVVMENGLSKMTKVTEYRLQGRGGSGVKVANITPKTGEIVGGFVLTGSEMGDIICMSKHGQTIRMALKDIPERSRATQGVIVMRLEAGDKVASISLVMEAQGEHAAEVVEEALKKAQKEEAVLMKELAAEGSDEEHALLEEEPVRHAEPLDSARGKLRPPRHGEPRRTTKHPAPKVAKETKKPEVKKMKAAFTVKKIEAKKPANAKKKAASPLKKGKKKR
jgi:DNA gyrase subunit A